MKKFLFSAAVVMSTIGICVANFSSTGSKLPLNNHTSYIAKDTVPSDTTKPKDSTLLQVK
jgi:hypothetical protein